jgi:protocatechuate 3,4-dioxygenase beta subunit
MKALRSQDAGLPTRRTALGALGMLGTLGAATAAMTESDEAEAAGICVVTAVETAGPYPLASALDKSAIVRRDITEGKTGTPVTLVLKIVDYDNGCTPLAGAAVYVWHCDADGEYSGYSSTANGSHLDETYLRGVQVTDSNGKVTFKTIFPGWYIPRLTHIHVEVFLAGTTLSSTAVATATTQLCFPDSVTSAVYGNTTLYPKGQNTVTSTSAADQVFGNGVTTETLTVSGSLSAGLAAGIVIGISSTVTSSESGDASSTGSSGGGGGPGGTPPSAPGA